LVGVNADSTAEKALTEVKENKLNWRSFFDEGDKIQMDYEQPSFPTILLIDPQGVIQFVYDRDTDALDKKIEEMMAAVESAD